jgi:hypothetical protein
LGNREDKIRAYYNSLHRSDKIQSYYNSQHRQNKINSFYVNRGRSYYGAALDESNDPERDVTWSGSPSLIQNPNASLFKAGLVTGGVLAAGKLPFGQGRVWDKYVSGLRHFEEYFFGRIPRTLQLSNIASQFETAARQTRLITPDQLAKYSAGQIGYLEKLTGKGSYDILRQGLRFDNGKLSFAESGEVILKNAGILRNVNKSAHFSTSYARSLGVKNISEKLFSESLPFTNAAGQEVSEISQIIGHNNRLGHVARQLGGYGTELVERANRLAKSDLPFIGKYLRKALGKNGFGVESGSGFETLARLTGKLGILGGAAVLGYQTADWAVRNTDALNNTAFDKGITAGIATGWAKLNLSYAKIGDLTGWTQRSKNQEQYAPGSTDVFKLAAFPIMGAIAAASGHFLARNIMTARLQRRGHDVAEASELAGKVLKRFVGDGLFSTLGKSFKNSNNSILRSIGHSPLTMLTTAGALLGAIPILPFIFNALAPSKSEDELRDIYSGKQEVAIKKNRWWTLGRSPYEGSNTQYYRENWFARMMHGGKEKQIWGPLETDGEISPVGKFIKSNFTYDVERAHYYDRPFPVSGQAFNDVPIIGPLLSATVGRIIKSSILMHQDEFYNSSNGSYLNLSPGFGVDRNTSMGEQPPGTPINPGFKNAFSEQMYRMQQLTGLPGFLMSTIKKAVTGSPGLFDQERQLQSADDITSASRGYYDMNLGDIGGTNEFFRRLLPHKQNQIETYNPIRNSMPDWMIGSGDRGPDLQHGDPYSAIPEGEIRLPGEGFAAAHPELKGVDPADYPDIWKYKILADVAPFSSKFNDVEKRIADANRERRLSEDEKTIYDQTKAQLKEKRNKRTFDEYKYRKEKLDPVEQALSDWNEKQKDPATQPSWFEKTLGSYWQTLAHNVGSPFEYLTPVSPAAKLIHMQTAIEDYSKNQVYGTENAFWDRPWSNFIRPFLTSSAHALGNDKVPGVIKDKRKVEEYFDILKYLKFTRLKNIAGSSGDEDAKSQFEQKRRETLFGINPFGFDYSEIFRALPRRDRDYYNAFAETKDLDKRAEILKLIPENEKGLFVAKWRQSDSTDFAKAVKLGLLKQDEIDKGNEQVKKMYDDMSTEGMPKSKDLWQEYIKTRTRGESYPDWYRRAKLLPQKANDLGMNIPGPDFVGWNPNVDLDDIKLKVVQNLGESIQDYDLWPNREKQLAYKKAFINDEAIAPIERPNKSDPSEIRNNIQKILTEFNIQDVQIDVTMMKGNNNHVHMDIQEDRSAELKERLRAN